MEKNGQKFHPPEFCPSCGSPMDVVNEEYGLRQCRQHCSGIVWDRLYGWDPATKEPLLESIAEREHPHPVRPHPLQPVADYLDYGLRQTITLVQQGNVTGITYADGEVHVSSHGYACVSPIGDDRFYRFTLPRGTESVATAVYPGVVSSGFIACRVDITSGKVSRHIEARAEAGHSGLMLGVVCFNASGEVIPPPSLES
jgi:hypothetical protein